MTETSMNQERLATLVRNEPLIEAEPSIRGIMPSLLTAGGGAIYYGTGLTTPRSLSVGLPFDVLGMVLTAEKLRRTLGLTKVIHHIADTHALTNSFATPEAVSALADDVEHTLARVSAHLAMPELAVIRSSTFDSDPAYAELLATIHTAKGNYVRRELADMLWYGQRHGLVLKMGWIIQATETEEGFDERLYDAEYLRLFGTDLSFVYLKAGRTFDSRRRKVSPYISVPGEQRILLRADEKVQEKIDAALAQWPDKTLGGAIKHLKAIVRLYDELAKEPAGSGTLPEKVQRIIDRIFE